MIGRITHGQEFGDLSRYLTEKEERVGEICTWNAFETEPMRVAEEMQDGAARSRTDRPVYHVSISFDEHDPLGREDGAAVLKSIGKQTLKDLGLEEHQALVVTHTDTKHPHVHLMVSRVHPQTGRAWNPWQDRRRLRESLERQERARGLRLTGRNVGDPEQAWAFDRPGRSLGTMRRAKNLGREPLPDRVRAAALGDFEEANGWADLERRLAASGLCIEGRRQGAGGQFAGGVVRAREGAFEEYAGVSTSLSKISRRLSLPKLERKFDQTFFDYKEREAILMATPEERSKKALTFAAGRFRQYLKDLPESHAAKQYLRGRGISEAQQETYQIGYAPDGWSDLTKAAKAKGYSGEDLEAAGLAKERKSGRGHYDRFRGRIMFPVTERGGQVQGFGARLVEGMDGSPVIREAADSEAKYVNSPTTDHYDKSRLFFGMAQAEEAMQESGEVVVTEGYTDAMRLREAGVENTVALAGTRMTEGHAETLREAAGEGATVTLVMDGDEAGREGAAKAVEHSVNAGLRPRVANMPEGYDADRYARERGAEKTQQTVQEARPWAEHIMKGGGELEEKAEHVKAALSMAAAAPTRELREEHYAQVARAVGGQGYREETLRAHYEGELGRQGHPIPERPKNASRETATDYERIFGKPAIELKNGGPSKTVREAASEEPGRPSRAGSALQMGSSLAREIADPITDEREVVSRGARLITTLGQLAAQYRSGEQEHFAPSQVRPAPKTNGRFTGERFQGDGLPAGAVPTPTPQEQAAAARKAEEAVRRWSAAANDERGHDELTRALHEAEEELKRNQVLGAEAEKTVTELGRRVEAAYEEPRRAAETLRVSVREDGAPRTVEDLSHRPERFGELRSGARGNTEARAEAKEAAAALTRLREIRQERLPAEMQGRLQAATEGGRSTLSAIEERLSSRGTTRDLRGAMGERAAALSEHGTEDLKSRVGDEDFSEAMDARVEHVARSLTEDYQQHQAAQRLHTERTGLTRAVREGEARLDADERVRERQGTAESAFNKSLKVAYQDPDQAKMAFEKKVRTDGPRAASRQMRQTPEEFGHLKETTERKYMGLSKRVSTEEATRAARRAASEGKAAAQVGAGRRLGQKARAKLSREVGGMKSRIKEITQSLQQGGSAQKIAGRMRGRVATLGPKARERVAQSLAAGPKVVAFKGAAVVAQQTKQVMLDRRR